MLGLRNLPTDGRRSPNASKGLAAFVGGYLLATGRSPLLSFLSPFSKWTPSARFGSATSQRRSLSLTSGAWEFTQFISVNRCV